MVTVNVHMRVYRIRRGAVSGTCFAIDIDGRQYMVTAKHVLPGLGNKDRVEFFYKDEWIQVDVRKTGEAGPDVDVTVFAADQQMAPAFPLLVESTGLMMAQELYFLGFPYGQYFTNAEAANNRGFPLAFVKRAIVSAFSGKREPRIWYLDGINNPGFSGGPVVWTKPGTPEFRVLGVVSSFASENQSVTLGGNATELRYTTNTGIINCYDGRYALDLIKANPNGVPVEPLG
jgi:hypothetical protein